MTISAYLSIITLKVKTLNSLPKEHKVAEQIIKIKTRPFAVHTAHKRLTSDIRPHRDWKWRDGKKHSMQM